MAKFKFIQWLIDWFDNQLFFVFDWDSGNENKNQIKHNISIKEAEEIFLNKSFILLGEQFNPPTEEYRYATLGRTINNKYIFVSFTLRINKIRIISARPMHIKERDFYEKVCDK